jgi:hypothetical protein
MKITPEILKGLGFTYHKANDCWMLGDYTYRLSDPYRTIKSLKELVSDLRSIAVLQGEQNVRNDFKKIIGL